MMSSSIDLDIHNSKVSAQSTYLSILNSKILSGIPNEEKEIT